MNIFIILFAVIAGFVNGIFGVGGGTVLMPILYKYLGDERNAHNCISFFVLPLSVISSTIYRKNVDGTMVLFVCIGALLGGFLGLKMSKKFSVDFLKIMFGLIIIFSGVSAFL